MSVRKNFRRSQSSLMFFFLIILVQLSSSKSDELQTLLNLKSALSNSKTDVFNSWTHQNSVCNFTGITCNANAFVKEINLSQKQLQGALPFDSICQLQSLEKISMGMNFLHGIITEDLKNCRSLQFLDLGENLFSGQVPDLSSLHELKLLSLNGSAFSGSFPWTSLQNLTNLEFLSLGDNPFSATTSFPFEVLKLNKLYWLYLTNCSIKGEIPEGISNLTLLENLELSDNQLFGEIPAGIGKLSKLWQLEIYSNSLTGKLPVGFGNLTSLVNFDASENSLEGGIMELRNLKQLSSLQLFENQFAGEIPEEFGEFKFLTGLSLYRNKFTGAFPEKIGSRADLTFIDISENLLTGSIPPDMCKNGKLTHLLILQNNFTGQIPESYSNCKSLVRFRAGDNSLSGSVPAGIWSLPNLTIIDFSMNQLEGPLTSDIGNAKSLMILHLANNQFSGELPLAISQASSLVSIQLGSNQFSGQGKVSSSFCKLQFLEILDLSNNSLKGFIPPCLGNLRNNLSVLNLGRNYFQGTIPNKFSKSCALRYLNFKGNQLEGPIPPSIINCTHLELIDLSNNKIDDTFPYFLGILPQLQGLVIHSNKFHGLIKSFNRNLSFPKLRIFDLSNNRFNGPLPAEYFDNFEAIINSDRETRYMGEPNSRYYYSVSLILKGSEFELKRILSILTTIDMSSNSFTGKVPESIGKLKSLILLNLSHNCLTNEIPLSLMNLINLESLDLSSNNLSGRIPLNLADLTFLQVFNVAHNQLEGPIPQGKQFNTFERSSYEGNLGLCGFPLDNCNNGETQYPTPSNEDDDSESRNGFGWKAVVIGYGCGFVFGIAMGYLVFKTRKPAWFLRMVEGEGNQRPRRLKKKKCKSHGRRNWSIIVPF